MRDAAFLIVVAASAAFWLRYQRPSRMHSPLWMAFSTTAFSLLCVGAGLVGYRLSGGLPFTRESNWTGSVVWSQVWLGAALVPVALTLWWIGVRALQSAAPQAPAGGGR